MADPLLDTMANNYRLVAKLGAGGMGDVYKGVHETIGSRVAIKVLHATSRDEPESEQRFLREAKAVNLIDHDGIVKVLDAGRLANGRPFLVMELLDGSSLSELHRAGQVTMLEACAIMADVLDALEAAHRVGVVHRDLKPANIFRTKTGRTVVLDFGIAKLLAADGPARLTMMGSAVGTPHYMAPEQILDTEVGPAADIYTAGVVLFELLCGRLPFDGATVHIMNGHLEQRPPPPRTLRPEIPLPISDIVLKAMKKEPAARFPSAGAMRDALRDAIQSVGPLLQHAPAAALATGAPSTRVDRPVPVTEAPATAVQRPQPRDITTEPVPETARLSAQQMASHAPPYAPPIHAPPIASPAKRSRWPLVAGVLLAGAALGAIVVWKASEPSAKIATVHDAALREIDAAVVAEITPDAVVHDAAVPADAAVRPPELRAAHAAMTARVKTLPSMRAYAVTRCLEPSDVEAALPHEDDPDAAEARRLRAHYDNTLACRYLRAYDEVGARMIQAADERLARGEHGVAATLIKQQLTAVERVVFDHTFVDRRLRHVTPYQRDSRIPEPGRERIGELLRDARAEFAAGQFASANLLLDEAALLAWRSIRLREP